jgi:hypothetical protein
MSAAALISRSRSALGPGLGRIKSLHLSGICSAGDISGSVDTWLDVAGGRYATNTEAGPLTASYGNDGKIPWRGDSKGIVLPQTGPLATAIAADRVFNNTYALFSPNYGGASVSYLGAKAESGQQRGGIWIKPKDGYAEQGWFNSVTALPAEVIVNYGAETTITKFSGYHSIAGLEVPEEETTTRRIEFRDFYGHEQGFSSSERTCKYSTTEADVQGIDKHFGMPRPTISDVTLPGGETRIPFTMKTTGSWLMRG